MRSAIAVTVSGLLGAVACGEFAGDAEPPAASEPVADGGQTPRAKDAAVATTTGADAGGACETIIDEPFSTASVGGWKPGAQQTAPIEFIAGPEGRPSLHVLAHSTGAPVKGYLEQTVDYPVLSAHAEFDLAVERVDALAAFGCALNLTRTVLFTEARVGLLQQAEPAGLFAWGSLYKDGTSDTFVQLTPPPLETWSRVKLDLAVAADGFVERSITLGTGERQDLGRARPPGEAPLDAVHVLCGVITVAGANSYASVYVRNVVVTACKRP